VSGFAVCERVVRQGSFAADVALTAAAGVAGLGVDAETVDTIGAGEAARVLDGEGVRASSYMGLDDMLGAESSFDAVARRLDIAAVLGAPIAVVMTGPLGGLHVEDADARCRDWVAHAASLAADRGLRVGLEPVHPLLRRFSFVHTFEHALALIDGIAGAGIVFDTGHLWWEREVDALVGVHIASIATVQLTNVDAGGLEEFRYERSSFENGDVPLASIVTTLRAAGYRGWYENEVLIRIPRDQRLDALRRSHAWFNAL
jgi:sugar phosphate isomerase/epimerase